MKCKDCKFWQDFSDRVAAVISESRSPVHRNVIELRRCRNVPPPSVSTTNPAIYTDEDYSCGGFVPKP